MLKKPVILVLISIFLYSCGTILKPYQVNKPHSDKLDVTVVVLDALGLLLFIIPGVVSYTVDYLNGTLYLPTGRISLNDKSDEGIQKALVSNGYNVSLDQIKEARKAQTTQ
ncbi:hypothetical protein HPDP_01039 [Candidatus Hepatincola sp. Pdp]